MALWNWKEDVSRWSFVVDTDRYAGNFDRELATYLVGRCDNDGFNDKRVNEYRELYEADFKGRDPFEDLLSYRADDHGDDLVTKSPMALAPNREGNYNSIAIFFLEKPTPEITNLLAKRARQFSELPLFTKWDSRPKVLGCRLVEERTVILSSDVVRVDE